MEILKLVKLAVLTEVHVGGSDADDISVADTPWQSQGRDLHSIRLTISTNSENTIQAIWGAKSLHYFLFQ
jgi:hypothetical protein